MHKVKQKPIEIDRAAANDPAAIQEWYTLYRNTKEQWGIQPYDEYNFDESGFRIGIGGSQWIITRVSDTKRMHSASETNRDFASVLEAISGDGVVLAPAVIIKGQQIMHQHLNNTSIPGNYMLGAQTKGYSNDDLAFDWIQYFNRQSTARQMGAHRLLLLDSYGSHLIKEFVEYCKEKNIYLLAIPPYISHFL